MRKITVALASVAILGFAAPASANEKASGQDLIQLARADVKVKVKSERPQSKIVIRHDRGRHLGFSHSRHLGYGKSVTLVKKRPGTTVIKKKIEG